MNPVIFDVDFNKLVFWHIPNKLKKLRLLNWARSLVKPLQIIYNGFRIYRAEKKYQLSITSQKCLLERLLNDRYDSALRRIYIDDLPDKPPLFIFRRAENKPVWLKKRSESAPLWLYTRPESGYNPDYFIVFVPLAVDFDFAEMSSLVKVYKLAGVRFRIQTY